MDHEIFGIYKLTDNGEPTTKDVLKPGNKMVAAGYCMYGSSSMAFTGTGVHGFTLDPSLGEFMLTHPDIKYVEKCKFPKDGSPAKSIAREPSLS
ncbi:hypothetical protein AALP_AA8G025000 [Arabis alpina]|uniref:fructose-bisphosphatase n=1 Tax=Arabis alpina TaxID=50452 RepID=A0A087G4I6_ARAAL|nr:hypothetical protein AALP_AA8G025000 [Arabis alpina]